MFVKTLCEMKLFNMAKTTDQADFPLPKPEQITRVTEKGDPAQRGFVSIKPTIFHHLRRIYNKHIPIYATNRKKSLTI